MPLGSTYHYHPRCIAKKAETQQVCISCPKSHCQQMTEPVWEPGWSKVLVSTPTAPLPVNQLKGHTPHSSKMLWANTARNTCDSHEDIKKQKASDNYKEDTPYFTTGKLYFIEKSISPQIINPFNVIPITIYNICR